MDAFDPKLLQKMVGGAVKGGQCVVFCQGQAQLNSCWATTMAMSALHTVQCTDHPEPQKHHLILSKAPSAASDDYVCVVLVQLAVPAQHTNVSTPVVSAVSPIHRRSAWQRLSQP
jgi:hypothetical protein